MIWAKLCMLQIVESSNISKKICQQCLILKHKCAHMWYAEINTPVRKLVTNINITCPQLYASPLNTEKLNLAIL